MISRFPLNKASADRLTPYPLGKMVPSEQLTKAHPMDVVDFQTTCVRFQLILTGGRKGAGERGKRQSRLGRGEGPEGPRPTWVKWEYCGSCGLYEAVRSEISIPSIPHPCA